VIRPADACRAAWAALALALVVPGASGQPKPMRPDTTAAEQEWLGGVHSALGHRDCARVVSRLNDGLEKRFPEAYVMAGALYEQGLCLKAQWDRAATMYQRALAAGHRGGHYRLVAGMAERDAPVALWWAQEGDGVMLPEACRVPADRHRDAGAFAAVLQSWPAGRIAACAYMAGVVAAVSGEIEYPGDAIGTLVEGGIRLHFKPAEGRIEWLPLELSQYSVANQLRDQPVMPRVNERLRAYAEEVGRRALARFPRPDGIDPSWQALVDFRFDFNMR
jgi:hypothetical protein